MKTINGEKLKVLIEYLNQRFQKKSEDKKLAKVVKNLGQTACHTKKITDDLFMGMKEDYMHKRPLKPGYKVQIGTEIQFVVEFSIHTNNQPIEPVSNLIWRV